GGAGAGALARAEGGGLAGGGDEPVALAEEGVGPRCRGGGLAERPLQVRVAAAGLAGAGSDTPGEPRCLRSFFSERRLLVSSLVREALPAEPLVVAIDPGKVADRVWLASGGA